MKSAFAPLASSRNTQFSKVCATSRKSARFANTLSGIKYLIFHGLLHLTRWSGARWSKPICSTAPLAPPPFRVGAMWSGANMPLPWLRSRGEVLPPAVSLDSKFQQVAGGTL